MVALVTLAVFVFSGKIRSIRSLVAEADVAHEKASAASAR